MEYVTLNNGVQMPKLGFGVFQIPKADCERCVLEALEVGYRHIDTAQSYLNEAEVGRAVKKCGLPREKLFLTTKVWISNYGQEQAKKSVLQSLEKLQVEYLDLVLLHQPFGDYYGAYRALEELYAAGKIRALGVSNFAPDRLADIAAFNMVKPQVNQIEVNPFHQQQQAQKALLNRGVQMEAWAPFGEGQNGMFENPTLQKIAARYGKSVAQVILRWLMQRNVVALAKSTHKKRMQENFAIFDFMLDAEAMEQIATLDTGASLFFDHQAPETVDMFLKLIDERKALL